VGNLSWATTNELLTEFVQAQSIQGLVNVQIQRHKDTNRSKGWGLTLSNSNLFLIEANFMFSL
jgi:hypothetical protein